MPGTGHNHVGRWHEEADNILEALREDFERAELKQYWSAYDWLHPIRSDIVKRALVEGVEKVADEEWNTPDAELQYDDVEETIRGWVEEHKSEHAENDGEDDEG